MSLVCITNDMPGVRSCTIRGQHSICDGWRGEKECKGCLPRSAEHGLLCWACWERLITVMTAWPEFAQLVAPLDRVMMPDNAGVRSSTAGHIPLPQTWLDVNEAESFLLSLTSVGANTDAWVSSESGAKDAVNFMRVAERAFISHPIEEKPHKIVRTRCFKCSMLTLVWNPPKYLGDAVKVTCRNPGCLHEIDQTSFEVIAQIEEKGA